MAETESIGELLLTIYSDEEEFKTLFTTIKEAMTKNEKLAEKNKKILDAIKAQVDDI